MKETHPRIWKRCFGGIGLILSKNCGVESGVIMQMTVAVRYDTYGDIDEGKIHCRHVGQDETINGDVDECHVPKRRIDELQMWRRKIEKGHVDGVHVHYTESGVLSVKISTIKIQLHVGRQRRARIKS